MGGQGRRVAGWAAAVTLAAGIAACGGGDDSDAPSGATLTEEFERLATEAYEAQDLDRETDFTRGVIDEDCFILDDEAAAAVGEILLGVDDAKTTDANFLQGVPGEEERMTCGLASGDEGQGTVVTAGTTLANAEQTRERFLRQEDAEEIEGEPEDLDPDSVVAGEVAGAARFAWVSEDFVIGVSAPADAIEPEEGFEALAVAVDEVARTLGG